MDGSNRWTRYDEVGSHRRPNARRAARRSRSSHASNVVALSERDHILRAAADRYCVGMSDRQAALVLHARLARYREGAWRRDRIEALCPT